MTEQEITEAKEELNRINKLLGYPMGFSKKESLSDRAETLRFVLSVHDTT